MHRFFISSQNITGDKVIIFDPGQLHHLWDVLRLKAGDEVFVCDERGNEYKASIENISRQKAELKIKAKIKFTPARIKITVACAIPKKSRMDDIIDKLTQLGVYKVIPLSTKRVVVKLDKNKERLRLERWRKIALSSAKQSQRRELSIIEPIKNLKEVLSAKENFDLKLMPTLAGKRKALKEALNNSNPRNILVLIGPEGDFTQDEVELAKLSGFIPVSLGDLVLRVETAAIAAVSYIRLFYL